MRLLHLDMIRSHLHATQRESTTLLKISFS
jgi:hypothetical protein